jgi:alginate O-acetyltransferase complex protein AlgI
MLFNTLTFLAFVVIVSLIYPRLRMRQQNVFLLLASYVFYGWWDWRFCILLFSSTTVDFLAGRRIHATENFKQRKSWLLFSIVVNLGILGFFKYFNFFLESAASVLGAIGFDPHMPVLKVILPIGISFYTFRTLTYTIDIYRKKISPTENFVDYALFVSFFPQILAGPIERASNLLPQISSPRRITRAKVMAGLNLILLGYFKKVAIADALAPMVGKIFDAPEAMSSGQLWTGVYAYTLQIYGDFSGYTDIARGVACILGFESMVNFNAPYFSRNITEFWRRWHISLSTWFRDYLYVPLGGSRYSLTRTNANLIITMLLCGIWHGSAWTFVLWGVMHGLCLMGHRMFLRGDKVSMSWPQSFSGLAASFLNVFLTFHFVTLSWVLFRSSSLENARLYYEGLLRIQNLTSISSPVIFAGVLLFALDMVQKWTRTDTWLTDREDLKGARYAVVLLLLVSILAASIANSYTVTPFIYYQF